DGAVRDREQLHGRSDSRADLQDRGGTGYSGDQGSDQDHGGKAGSEDFGRLHGAGESADFPDDFALHAERGKPLVDVSAGARFRRKGRPAANSGFPPASKLGENGVSARWSHFANPHSKRFLDLSVRVDLPRN